MIKRASRHDAPISKGINKIALGFTIIETMLFLAIAGLIFAGLVAGTNGAIRRQRYKDSVQGFVDDLRDLYSLVENTQVLDYEGTAICGSVDGSSSKRGRSNCSVYGIYAIISPNGKATDNIEAYWVTGVDQALISGETTDKEFFERAEPGIDLEIKDETLRREIVAKKHSLLWGADISIPCDSDFSRESHNGHANGCENIDDTLSNKENNIALFIYRSPITNSINTYSRWTSNYNAAKNNGKKANLKARLGIPTNFTHGEVDICITGGSGMSYDGGIRMIKIDAYGSNTNAVRLIEADSDENKCND